MNYMCTESANDFHDHLDATGYLELACTASPVIENILTHYGDCTIGNYLDNLNHEKTVAYQNVDDLSDVVFRYASGLMGNELAAIAAAQLSSDSWILTANHHGIDYFSQSVQGSILYALRNRRRFNGRSCVTIFSCGAVPLDNLTYPLGMLLYQTDGDEVDNLPKKLPIFSNRLRRSLVSAATPIDQEMIHRAEKKTSAMEAHKDIDSSLAAQVRELLLKDYGCPEVLGLSSYSRQAVVMNQRLWRRIFKGVDDFPDLVYLELEEVVKELLKIDLTNQDSLAWRVFFDTGLRENVIEELDNATACWGLTQLEKRLYETQCSSSNLNSFNGCGTVFFWGVNEKGKRVPLYLEKNNLRGWLLRGIDDNGCAYEHLFDPGSISAGIEEKKLLPSLFTCFLTLSFARGITCAGGYYQCEYLPKMQRGLWKALKKTSGYQIVSELVQSVKTDAYLSGMQTVMTPLNDDGLIPAGTLEIMAAGGLSINDIEKILSLSVGDAHLASLFETMPDLAPWMVKTRDWRKRLAKECARRLNAKVVIKRTCSEQCG